MFDDSIYAVEIECACGAVFEPVEVVTDEYGEHWVVCPDCKRQIRLLAKD